MDLYWLGDSSFKLKGKLASVLIRSQGVSIEDLNFSGPGEYESKGVMVEGLAEGESIVYQVVIDGLNIVYVSGKEVEGIEQTDILLTPIGGVVADLEPRIIVPYADDEENLGRLLKELGAENLAPQPKLSITKDKLPEEPVVVVLDHAK